jgi:hypothetical protein
MRMLDRETSQPTAMTPAHSASGDPANPRCIDHALRLRSLWIAYLLAMLFHVQLGLMPLFHGLSVVIGNTVNPSRLTLVYWSMMGYFLLPLAALLMISWAASDGRGDAPWRPWRRWHFWLSVIYSVTNLIHLIADIFIPDSRGDQVFLMALLLLIGLLINRQAWLWWHPRLAAMQT